MARGTPQQIAEKWATRLGGATQSIQDGVNRVTTAPGQKAAQQKQAYVDNVVAKSDKWAARVAAVSLEEWKSATVAGASRVSAGAQAKKGKMQRHMENFLPFLDTVQAKVAQMPRGTLEQNLARMMVNARELSQYRGNR